MARKLRNFENDFKKKYNSLDAAMKERIPRIIANEHERGFKKSFKLQRFNDYGGQSWKRPQRKDKGSPFPPPTVSHLTRNTLIGKGGGGMSGLSDAFRVRYTKKQIEIENTKEYAGIHNDGGTVTTSVTKKFRKFAWAMYYKSKKRGAANYESWKNLALTKKSSLTHKIPKRQFMGHSRLIDEEVNKEIDETLNEIL